MATPKRKAEYPPSPHHPMETNLWALQFWQLVFICGVVGLTIARHWPWTHTVFFVLHGLVLLMKQHSYAFYNGHLYLHKERTLLVSTLGKLHGRNDADTTGFTTSWSRCRSISHSRRGLHRRSRHPVQQPSLDEVAEADTGKDEPGDREGSHRDWVRRPHSADTSRCTTWCSRTRSVSTPRSYA